MSVGANPAATFPNAHLTHLRHSGQQAAGKQGSQGSGVWACPAPMPTNTSVLSQLREAVAAEDWARAFAENKTRFQAEAKWAASADRCAALQCLCTIHKATNVLEIGSFCGVAALAMAEALPKTGKVVALELEPYFVEFGAEFRMKSQAGSNIETTVGPAGESLEALVAEVMTGSRRPFDFVLIDGDKSSIAEYLRYVRSPGFLGDAAVICLDMALAKGRVPTRYLKFGAESQWKACSGEEEIVALRKAVEALPDFVSHEFGGLLVLQRRPQAPSPLEQLFATCEDSDSEYEAEEEEEE